MYEANSQANETPGLEDYLKAIQARKWLVIAFAIAGLILAALFAASRTSSYDAEATVVLRPTPAGGNSGVDQDIKTLPNLETERAKFTSLGNAQAVKRELGLDIGARELLKPSKLSVQFEPQGQVLEARFTDENPETAALIVNSFADNYVEQRNAESDEYYEQQLTIVQGDFDQLQAQLDDINEQSAAVQRSLQETFGGTPTDSEIAARAGYNAELQNLNQLRATVLSPLNTTRSRVQVLTRSQATLNLAPPGEVLRAAAPPTEPNGLGSNAIRIAGLLAGLLLGIAAAFVLDRLDNTAREESDVELAIAASVLGTVPPFGFSNRTGASALVMLSSSKATSVQRARESFRRLRTSLQYLATTDNIHSLLITSAQPSEGKSVSATNLAIALAQGGSPTVLVSADMRRPSIENLFGIGNTEGLSTALQAREVTPPPIVSVGVENLAVIPSGPTPANPGELLGSARFRDLIRRLEATYEYVVVDTPPVLSAADAIAASASVGGVVVLVDSRRTDTSTLLQVRSDLDRAGARVLGAILNRDRSRDAGFFSRRDRYAYERASKNLVS